jgi:hypothetical protein
MLQTCDVGICVEEEGEAPDVATHVATWSQYSRNMVVTWGGTEEAH